MSILGDNWIYKDPRYFENRGGIETHASFVERNIQWWKANKEHEERSRKPYYEQFLDLCDCRELHTSLEYTIGEVGPGPFGGILEVCKVNIHQKVFIDPIIDHLVRLDFIQWPKNARYVMAPAESIPLEDNAIDILFSYNCLDHGWDIYKAIQECVRISKRCFLCFDCRGDNEEEVKKRKAMNDLDHYQLIKYGDISCYCEKDEILRKFFVRTFDMDTRWEWAVAFLEFSKV